MPKFTPYVLCFSRMRSKATSQHHRYRKIHRIGDELLWRKRARMTLNGDGFFPWFHAGSRARVTCDGLWITQLPHFHGFFASWSPFTFYIISMECSKFYTYFGNPQIIKSSAWSNAVQSLRPSRDDNRGVWKGWKRSEKRHEEFAREQNITLEKKL